MFPAVEKPGDEIISQLMLSFLSEEDLKHQYIFHISYPHFLGLNKELIDTYKGQRFVLTFHGETSLPINSLFRLQRNPLKKFFYLKQHFSAKHYFKAIDYVTYQTEKNIDTLKRYYSLKLAKVTMGIDTNKFKVTDKGECRGKLGLSDDIKILLTVSRLYELKQLDKMIEILSKINENFIFLVVGHGNREYEKYLQAKASSLSLKNKIRFEGYKESDELVTYYNAADLFIHVSESEAGPVSVMEAMACVIPIFCTNTGNTAEVLKANKAGIIVGEKNYKEWHKKLIEYFNGQIIKPLGIDIVKENYDWVNIAAKFIGIYKNALL
jgi:glycosyltransferase involved in cell wall biosynthesis